MLQDFLLLYRRLLTQFNEGVTPLRHLLIILQYVINDLRTNTNIVDDEIDSALADVNQRADELEEQGRARQQELQRAGDDYGAPRRSRRQVQPPPNDFRDISIFPDINTDIHTTEKPFLRENIIKGEFEDGEHYLDVQFRLMREDFIRPLRNGICEYMNLREDGVDVRRQRQKLTDVRIYHDVAILNPVCTPGGIQHRIRFDVSRMGRVQWRYSKRLIYGSLLCLSADDFVTIRIATVAQRDPGHLQDGELIIQFETDTDEIRLLPPTERFLMVESSAYFEAYRHVLLALQRSREEDIPFLNNVVLCNRNVDPPQYLRTAEDPVYDLRAIAGRKVNLFQNREEDDDIDDGGEDHTDPDDMPVAAVPVLQRGRWPSAETLHVDESQLRAIQTALSKRIAIIQGPPGTGKTYIGLKVVQVLLQNSHVLNTAVTDENSPILVVCYTNHALDQFLEGLCKFVRMGMVRVGGRSKSKRLEQFLLRELRKRSRELRTVPRGIFLNRVEARSEMELQQVEIERQTAIIESTERGLIHEDALRSRFMFEGHYDDLTNIVGVEDNGGQSNLFSSRSKFGKSFLPLWLGLEDIIYSEEQPDNNNPEQANVEQGQHVEQAAEDAEDQEEEEEDLENAARAEEGERIIEDEDDEMALRRLEEQRRRRQNERRAEEQLAVNFDNVLEATAEAAIQGQWKTQKGTRKKKRQLLRRELQKNDLMTIAQVNAVRNVWALSPHDRWRLYRYWLSLYRAQLKENIKEAERNFQMAANRRKELLEEEDMAIMRKMKIIGMTTTGAARYKNVLRRIAPKIVIVEEAAEVLEAHVVTTLSAQCQHLILIGDHQQLRPSPNVYDLAENYNLKYSLFERLIINELEHETLERQHRMRPEIANFLRIIYPRLVDDQSVKAYENVKGVSRSLYFISHSSEEHRDDELKSMSNEHEATYLVALCNYLVLQGYAPSRITVLTPYTGQVFLVRRMLRQQPMLQDVRLCPVDNYQGEENDIILLSVVRSCSSSKLKPSIGFVKDENRICVALSRAKIGLYVVGNFQHLARNSELWSKVVQKAKEMGVIGDSLRLVCQNHPEQAQIETRKAEDFNKAPEGGCMRECGYRLSCGHACERVCHSYDRDHMEYKCRKTCTKILCAHGHRCTKACHETCGRCTQVRRRLLLIVLSRCPNLLTTILFYLHVSYLSLALWTIFLTVGLKSCDSQILNFVMRHASSHLQCLFKVEWLASVSFT